MIKKALAVLAAATLTLSLAACSGGSKKSSVDIGIVLPTKDEPRWVQDETRFTD